MSMSDLDTPSTPDTLAVVLGCNQASMEAVFSLSFLVGIRLGGDINFFKTSWILGRRPITEKRFKTANFFLLADACPRPRGNEEIAHSHVQRLFTFTFQVSTLDEFRMSARRVLQGTRRR